MVEERKMYALNNFLITMFIIGMADYQYIPNPNDSVPKYRKELENLDGIK